MSDCITDEHAIYYWRYIIQKISSYNDCFIVWKKNLWFLVDSHEFCHNWLQILCHSHSGIAVEFSRNSSRTILVVHDTSKARIFNVPKLHAIFFLYQMWCGRLGPSELFNKASVEVETSFLVKRRLIWRLDTQIPSIFWLQNYDSALWHNLIHHTVGTRLANKAQILFL